MKIISFNACLLPNDLSNTRRLELFFANFSEKNDVLLLSEVWDTFFFSSSSLAIYLGKKYNFPHYFFEPRKWYQMCNNGLIILSKYPILSTSSLTFRSSCGLQWFVPNGAIACEIKTVPSLFICTTHIHAGSLDTSFCNSPHITKKVQLDQIKELKEFIDKNKKYENTEKEKEEKKWIVCGDFNIDAIKISKYSSFLLDYCILKETMKSDSILKHIGFPNTYPVPELFNLTPPPLVNTLFLGEKSCIDHAFTNVPVHSISVQALEKDNIYLSDHACLLIELDILSKKEKDEEKDEEKD